MWCHEPSVAAMPAVWSPILPSSSMIEMPLQINVCDQPSDDTNDLQDRNNCCLTPSAETVTAGPIAQLASS